MPDNETPNAQAEQSAANAQQPQTQDGNAQPESADKSRNTFSPEQQSIVDGIVQERLARERAKIEAKARQQFESELAEQKRQAELSEQERVKEAQAQLEQQRAELELERQTLKRSQALAGRVIDVDKALRLVEDAHITEDGTLDVDKFLQDNPFLAQQAQQPRATTPANVTASRASTSLDDKAGRSNVANSFLRNLRNN